MIVRRWVTPVLVLALVSSAGCDNEQGKNERIWLREHATPVARRLVRDDFARTRRGTEAAAARMARGFLVEDPARREREMRSVLMRLDDPPRGIPELIVTPATFTAAVGMDGKVIARDVEPDPMRGFDIGEIAPHVRRALRDGVPGEALIALPSTDPEEPPSITILFVHPSVREGAVVGAVIVGLPLWRMGQQITNQLQLENASELQSGVLLWALLYKGDELHYHAGFPDGLRAATPSPEQRRVGFSRSANGYTGELHQYGRWYGYAVVPLPSIGEDVGVVLFRSDPG
jgi:hypothetical protein